MGVVKDNLWKRAGSGFGCGKRKHMFINKSVLNDLFRNIQKYAFLNVFHAKASMIESTSFITNMFSTIAFVTIVKLQQLLKRLHLNVMPKNYFGYIKASHLTT